MNLCNYFLRGCLLVRVYCTIPLPVHELQAVIQAVTEEFAGVILRDT